MHRRAFLQSAAAFTAVASLPWRESRAEAPWRTFEVTTRADIVRAQGISRAWLPLPSIDGNGWQKVIGNRWSGNAAKVQVLKDAKYGVGMLYAEWRDGETNPFLELHTRFATRDRAMDIGKPIAGAERLSAAERAFYTAPSELIPTDGIVKDTATQIVKRKRTDIDRARAIYEWVVDTTYRDPNVRGCGWGDIKAMLETRNFGGRCGDLNALFVGLLRSVGVPARDVYGIRVAPSRLGYKSLGANSEVISKAQHCRAEFYAEGVGWVPVDPADVRKVILEEPPGHLPLTHRLVTAARARLFGGWEMNWLAYNMGHDLTLPQSSGPKLPYLMYPNGETGGERLDQLDPDAFTYTLTARELQT